ncbi:MAG: hypothetical protein ACLFSM_05830 [Thermoplasmata archaeon]
MILVDTNILSTFAKVNRLDLLEEVLGNFHISPNVLEEVKRAEELGYPHAGEILEKVRNDEILIACPREKEVEVMDRLPTSFGRGEKDCLAIALKRDALIVTNEQKVLNYCKRNGVDSARLNTILRELLKKEDMEQEDVRNLIDEIEKKDNLVVTDKDSIFS